MATVFLLLLHDEADAWAVLPKGNSWWSETCALIEKTGICKHLCYPTIIGATQWTVFLKMLFQSYKYH